MRRWLAPTLALWLAGCAAPAPRPVTDAGAAWAAHRSALSALTRWHLVGRIAVQADDRGWHANIDWDQQEADYSIRLSGPFGSGSALLEGSGRGVTLRTSDGQSTHATDASWLLYSRLGWRVPVADLRYWVRGLPAPGPVGARRLNAAGYLEHLTQAGWTIRLFDYARHGGVALPGKVFAHSPQGEVRLVIDRWSRSDGPVGG